MRGGDLLGERAARGLLDQITDRADRLSVVDEHRRAPRQMAIVRRRALGDIGVEIAEDLLARGLELGPRGLARREPGAHGDEVLVHAQLLFTRARRAPEVRHEAVIAGVVVGARPQRRRRVGRQRQAGRQRADRSQQERHRRHRPGSSHSPQRLQHQCHADRERLLAIARLRGSRDTRACGQPWSKAHTCAPLSRQRARPSAPPRSPR